MVFGYWNSESGSIYFIAEAGVNHNGDVDTAVNLVDVAAEAGADAVKFQTFDADRLTTVNATTASYQRVETNIHDQRELLAGLELDEHDHEVLRAHCRRERIDFLSTPFDRRSASFLAELGVPVFKIGSGELTNHPLLRYVAELGRPLVVSTGMATEAEVGAAVAAIRSVSENPDLTLLHCTSAYPTAIEDVNLRAMQRMAETFDVPVGYSDHTTLVELPSMAVAAGATIVEKHFTLNRSQDGPDHDASLEPAELERAISLCRTTSAALGSAEKEPVEAELETRYVARKGLYATREVAPGDRLDVDAIAIKRPAEGLSPVHYENVIGDRAVERIPVGAPITADVLEGVYDVD